MHIPDNYLSPSTCAVLAVAAVPVWAISIKKVKEEIPRERIPLIGVGASFSFLMVMFNIPLPGGTTGHAVGSTLIAMILGPYAACIATSIALLIQALIFGDGGILSFGANCFNMAIVMPFAGYAIYKYIKTHFKNKHSETIGIIAGSYLGLNIAALCASIEFGIRGENDKVVCLFYVPRLFSNTDISCTEQYSSFITDFKLEYKMNPTK